MFQIRTAALMLAGAPPSVVWAKPCTGVITSPACTDKFAPMGTVLLASWFEFVFFPRASNHRCRRY
jgi:hypothetical protein